MGFSLSLEKANVLLNELKKEYRIYAPKRFEKQGRYSDTDIIRYDEINCAEEIVTDEKSTYTPKEILFPITQTILFFTEDEYRETKMDDKKILIFMRPCDINARKVQERIYMGNGGFEDYYYKRLREKVKFVMMECTKGWDTCFCVSMNTNKATNYAAAVRFQKDGILLDVKDEELSGYLKDATEVPFEVEFIKENETSVELPQIPNKQVLNAIKEHPVWNEYKTRCIGCGACTIACGTCTCFTTTDLFYRENVNVGERRRTYTSCQVTGFDEMAGGLKFRKNYADSMRYKVLHKVHDYKERFGENMCVGCGRCTDRCPQFISFSHTIEKLNQAVKEICDNADKSITSEGVK